MDAMDGMDEHGLFLCRLIGADTSGGYGVFHGMEDFFGLFHAMEKSFPWRGKLGGIFSIPWKMCFSLRLYGVQEMEKRERFRLGEYLVDNTA